MIDIIADKGVNMKSRIALYARISTNGGRQDTENQLCELREWAKRFGGEVIQEYIDEASGSRGDRKALLEMLSDAHERKFDTLAIWSLDRLSREGISKMTGYLDQLKSYGVRIVSLKESWLDTSGPIADLLVAIFGWVAQQERLRIGERVLAGLKTARARGKKLGRPVRKVDLQKAVQLKSQGLPLRQIAQFLGVPRSTLSRALSQKPIAVAV